MEGVCIAYTYMKERVQISINPELIADAEKIMSSRHFDSFSGLLEALIREEYERRQKNGALGVLGADMGATDRQNEAPPAYKTGRQKKG